MTRGGPPPPCCAWSPSPSRGGFQRLRSPRDHPADRADQADQHHQRVAVEVARLQANRGSAALLHRPGKAIGPETIDRPLVTALPQQTPEPERGPDEDRVVEFVEVPLVVEEAVEDA